jgi:hypothetical protein
MFSITEDRVLYKLHCTSYKEAIIFTLETATEMQSQIDPETGIELELYSTGCEGDGIT